ncbi:MAG: DUF5667 domain-containing protein, partial [Chloroflexota bacterium]
MDEPIADIVEECRRRLARGETIEICLAAYPSHGAELARLLPIAARARSLARGPDPTFAELARRRFARDLAAARDRRQAMARPRSGPLSWLQNLLVPVAVVLVVILSGFGLVQASRNTLPDSPLYPVKQAQENVAQVLTRGPEARATLQIKTANQRLDELQTAERLRKGPIVLLTLADKMVQASTAATQQTGQTSGLGHQ